MCNCSNGANCLKHFTGCILQVEALCLINVVSTPAGWIEYGYQKLNSRYLKSKGMTQGVMDYLMWHHFGKVSREMRTLDVAEASGLSL